jgi:hypothetical protein
MSCPTTYLHRRQTLPQQRRSGQMSWLDCAWVGRWVSSWAPPWDAQWVTASKAALLEMPSVPLWAVPRARLSSVAALARWAVASARLLGSALAADNSTL